MSGRGYPASEKLEIIRIVAQSHLPAKRTLDQLGIPRRTFYRWYDRYLDGGPEALEDRPSAPSRVWNRVAPNVQDQIVEMALYYSGSYQNLWNLTRWGFWGSPCSDSTSQTGGGFAMSVPIRLRDDFSAADVRAHARRCKDGAQVRRLLAIATILDGGSRSDAALVGGVTRQIVRDFRKEHL